MCVETRIPSAIRNRSLEASAREKERDDHDLYGDAGKA
jgi:hypothetical protein